MNKIAITILVALISMNAMSQVAETADVDRAGFYLGGKFGRLHIDDTLKTNAWGIHGGYAFNRYISTEIAYISGVEFDSDNMDFDVEGLQFAIIPTLPINDDWSVTARLGYVRLKGSYDVYNFGSDSGYSTEFTYGVGVVRHIGQTFVRLEYEDIDNNALISLGFGVRF